MKKLAAYEWKELDQAGRPEWACGCPKCSGGLISPPDIRQFTAATYLVRMFQANAGRLTFCECKAGQMYREFLRGVYRRVNSGEDQVSDGFRSVIEDQVLTPTVHFDGPAR